MNKTEILKIAKEVITTEVENFGFKVIQIILFGSRARGDENPNSDWDFYVIIDKDIEFKIKQKLISKILIKLINYKIPADVLIQSQNVVKERENDLGFITYYAIREGQVI